MQVSGDDSDEYKRSLRLQLRALLPPPDLPGFPPEWIIAYVRPAAADPHSKSVQKVEPTLAGRPVGVLRHRCGMDNRTGAHPASCTHWDAS